ncbi:hypothetical protein ABGN05_24985 [Aquibium sp. LZ166]|uniref:DNA primase/polymerase bifunctional N-terminal domain-containing protein n=1 Tax=Aquibium pacificus TaxID=3153579 RepID=A0ABV3SQ22_9HYPH
MMSSSDDQEKNNNQSSVVSAPPGRETQYDKIPIELQAIDNWVIYKTGPGKDGKLSKTPLYWYNPDLGAVNVLDPVYQTSFENVRTTCENDPQGRYGVGFVLTEQSEFVVVDIDKKISAVDPDRVDTAAERLLAQVPTYNEFSISGGGRHIVYRGKLPHGIASANGLIPGVEIYAWNRFIAFTGKVTPGGDRPVADGSEIIERLFAARPEYLDEKERLAQGVAKSVESTRDLGRSLGYPDEHILRVMQLRCEASYDLMNADNCDDFSVAMLKIIGDLDKITGDPNQIHRIVARSNVVVKGPPNAAGEDRPDKLHRLFDKWMYDARHGKNKNTRAILAHVTPEAIEHGRQQAEVLMQAFDKDRQEKISQEQAKSEEDTRESYEVMQAIVSRDTGSVLSLEAKSVFALFPGDMWPNTEHEIYTPPGVMGSIIHDSVQTMSYPFLKYAVPSAFSYISGVTGRMYKQATVSYKGETMLGVGLATQWLLGGPSSSGKTESIEGTDVSFRTGHFEEITIRDENDQPKKVEHQPIRYRPRSYNQNFASAAELSYQISSMGCGVIYRDECASILEQLVTPKTQVDKDLEDVYLNIYDCSYATKLAPATGSIAARKEKRPRAVNVNISTFFSTVTSKMLAILGERGVSSGFMSRHIPVIHDRAAGKTKNKHRYMRTTAEIKRMYRLMNEELKLLDELCMPSETAEGQILPPRLDPKRDLRPVFFSAEAETFADKIEDIIAKMSQGIDDKISHLPEHYKLLARAEKNARRIAGTCAAVDHWYIRANMLEAQRNEIPPAMVTVSQMKWAFAYILMNQLIFASYYDRGEIAVSAASNVDAAVNKIKSLLKKTPLYRERGGIPKGELHKELKRVLPFKDSMNPSAMVEMTMREMIDHGYLAPTLVKMVFDSQRPSDAYRLAKHKVWKD